jgi:hypothetical protein
MNIINNNTDCLSFEQLEGYCVKTVKPEERKQIYIHITGCELCAAAVNGFSALPFSKEEVKQLLHKIDMRSIDKKQLQHIRFRQVLLVAASLFIIFGFYRFVNSISKHEKETAIIEINLPEVPIVSEKQITSSVIAPSVSSVKKEVTQKTKGTTKDSVKSTSAVESIEQIAVSFNSLFLSEDKNNELLKPNLTDDVMYIEDMKVVDYKKTYFYHPSAFTDIFDNTPASSENKKTIANESLKEKEHKTPAYEVLKNGLQYFKKQNYELANEQFQLLLDKNADDVNALFYSSICLCEMGYYSASIKNFKAVLNYSNHQFEEETKWKLALTYLKSGKAEDAELLLKEIVDEDGFYAARAKKQLNK